MIERYNESRRSVLRKAGVSIGTLLSGSGLASAADSRSKHHRTDSGVKVEQGKFVLDATADDIGRDTYRITRAAVESFNAVIEAGYLSIDGLSTHDRLTTQQAEETSLTIVEGTTAADIAAVEDAESLNSFVSIDQAQESEGFSSIISAQSCNRNDVTRRSKALPPTVYVNIFLGDGVISDINDVANYGAPGGALIYQQLVSRGIITAGLLAGPVSVVIFAAVAAYWGIVNIQNNGCGVEIKTGVSPLNPTVPIPTVSPQ